MSERKKYLGDGVYAESEGDTVKLTTSNGKNTIYLEPEVAEAMKRYLSDRGEC